MSDHLPLFSPIGLLPLQLHDNRTNKALIRQPRSRNKAAVESALFKIPTQPMRKAPGKRKKIPPGFDIYEAILQLRKAEFSVYRQGSQHLVDGRLLDDNEMYQIYREVVKARKAPINATSSSLPLAPSS